MSPLRGMVIRPRPSTIVPPAPPTVSSKLFRLYDSRTLPAESWHWNRSAVWEAAPLTTTATLPAAPVRNVCGPTVNVLGLFVCTTLGGACEKVTKTLSLFSGVAPPPSRNVTGTRNQPVLSTDGPLTVKRDQLAALVLS